MSEHGTRSRYQAGCRCVPCTEANRDYSRERWRKQPKHGPVSERVANRALLREALQEMFPFGLTEDCPARRRR